MINFTRLISIATPNFFSSTVGDVIFAVLPYVFGIAGFALLAYLILGGYEILTSQGDPKKVASGQMRITYALVGFVIIFASFWLVQLTAEILDLEKIRAIF